MIRFLERYIGNQLKDRWPLLTDHLLSQGFRLVAARSGGDGMYDSYTQIYSSDACDLMFSRGNSELYGGNFIGIGDRNLKQHGRKGMFVRLGDFMAGFQDRDSTTENGEMSYQERMVFLIQPELDAAIELFRKMRAEQSWESAQFMRSRSAERPNKAKQAGTP